MAWAKYRKTVAERYTRTGRAPLEEAVTYIGDENGTRSSRLLGAVSGSDRW
jgi:hypothetical protein